MIQPTFDNTVAFYVGPGWGMHVAGITIYGPFCPSIFTDCTYVRGNLPSGGVGLGTTGGLGGSSRNLIENVEVDNFQSAFETDANGGCCLADSTTFRKVSANNFFYGINLYGQQSGINRIDDPTLGFGTFLIYNQAAHASVTITGGNLSNEIGTANAFTISSVSSLVQSLDRYFPFPANGNGNNQFTDYSFTAVIASPDRNIPNVYNSWMIVTSHFGVVPVIMTGWNSGTNTATFMIFPPWVLSNYGTNTLYNSTFPEYSVTDINTEIQAATTIYGAERGTVFYGPGIHAIGVTVEETSACSTLVDMTDPTVFGTSPDITAGGLWDEIDNLNINDPANSQWAPADLPSQPQLAIFYCSATFPFIYIPYTSHVELNGGSYGQTSQAQPVIIDIAAQPVGINTHTQFSQRNVASPLFAPNVRYSGGTGGLGAGFVSITNEYLDQYSNGHGAGNWDRTPFLPHQPCCTLYNQSLYATFGELAVPFVGFRPAPWVTPSLPPGLFSAVSGSLGALGTYPVINCETVYKLVDWNSAALTHLWARSSSCPMFSYGQNLTNAATGGTITWSYKAQTNVLYLDDGSLSWMFAGLAISINNGIGPHTYIVTGVYPALGYVTVTDGAADATGGAPALLQGKKTAIYSCDSSCTIGQAPYNWTEYP